jgi:hypothetical protein
MIQPRFLVLAGALVALAGTAHGQQAATAPNKDATATTQAPAAQAPATQAPAAQSSVTQAPAAQAPAARSGPSPELLKKARDAGVKPEVRNGETIYCWKDADVGSRLPTKKCVNEGQLELMLDRRQQQRDYYQQQVTGGVKSN